MRQKFGDTTGYDSTIYPDYAVLDRPDPPTSAGKLQYTYRGGWGDPSTSTKDDADDRVVDLAAFDVETTVGVLRGAPETVGMERADVKDTYLSIDPSRRDRRTPGAV